MRSLFPLIAVLAIAGCGKPAPTRVEGAWIRLAAAPGRPSAGYLTLVGGAKDRTLTGATSPAVGRIELHETVMTGRGGATGGGVMGGMTMRPLGPVTLRSGDSVVFAPGGRHLMLFDVKPAIKPGVDLPLTLTFSDGVPLNVDATVIAAGDPPPAG